MAHVSILTGASRGIGEAIALLMLSKGAKIVVVARDQQKLEQLYQEHQENVAIVAGDVTDATVCSKAVKTAIEKFGRIDSIIANAGVLDPVAHVAEADVARWRKLYDINVFSVVQLVAEALPELRKNHGRIIAVSSGASTTCYDGWSAYGSSKAALNHLIKSIASEEPDVRTISVAPGVVDTSMQVDIRSKFGQKMKPEALKKFTDLHENGNLLPPSVPAAVYVKLALEGWKEELNGSYVRYNDEQLN